MNHKIRVFKFGTREKSFEWIVVGDKDYDNVIYTNSVDGERIVYKNQNLETILEDMTFVREMSQEELIAEMV